jgi:cation diffusion facilitator family transporter
MPGLCYNSGNPVERTTMPESSPDLHKKALKLSWFTLGYNAVECAASIAAGLMAGSVALIGFGLDSLIESLSAGIMIWRFARHGKGTEEEEERIEHRAEKAVGITFVVLAAYVLYESVEKLVSREIPEPSLFGIGIAAASIITMPILYAVKIKTGKEIGSKSLIADSRETLACAFLSAALLLGLGANYFFGFWQADPIVGLIIVVMLVREALEILRDEESDE